MSLSFKVEKEHLSNGSTVAIAYLSGFIDIRTVKVFEAESLRLLNEGNKYLILNFTNINYMNSTGLGLLVKVQDKYNENDGNLILVDVPQKILDLFKMLGMDTILDVKGTNEDALDSLPFPLLPQIPDIPDMNLEESAEGFAAPPMNLPNTTAGTDLNNLFLQPEGSSDSSSVVIENPDNMEAQKVNPIEFPSLSAPMENLDFGGFEISGEGDVLGEDTSIDNSSLGSSSGIEISGEKESEISNDRDIEAHSDVNIEKPDQNLGGGGKGIEIHDSSRQNLGVGGIEIPSSPKIEIPGQNNNKAPESQLSNIAPPPPPMPTAAIPANDNDDEDEDEDEDDMAISELDMTVDEDDMEIEDLGDEFQNKFSAAVGDFQSSKSSTSKKESRSFKAEEDSKLIVAEMEPKAEAKEKEATFGGAKEEFSKFNAADELEESDELNVDDIEEQEDIEEKTELNQDKLAENQPIREILEEQKLGDSVAVPAESVFQDVTSQMPEIASSTEKAEIDSVVDAIQEAEQESDEIVEDAHIDEPIVAVSGTTEKMEQIEPAKKEITEDYYKRKMGIRYYEKMNPLKSYPLLIAFSKKKLQRTVLKDVKEAHADSPLKIKKSKPEVTVTPYLKGCTVYPPSMVIDVTPEMTSAEFWVTPIIEGDIQGTVDIVYDGKIIEKISFSSQSVKQTWARVSAVGAITVPILSFLLEGLNWNLPQTAWNVIPKMITQIESSVGLSNFGAVFGALSIITGIILYNINKPKEAEELEKFFSTN